MSDSSENHWYDLGYALEAARSMPGRDTLRRLGERLADFRSENAAAGNGRPDTDGGDRDPGDAVQRLLVTGGSALVVKLLRRSSRPNPGWGHVARAALAGAGATLLREFTAPLLRGRFEAPEIRGGLGGRVLSGAARGALYGSLIEPRLPGSPLVRGLTLGVGEYMIAPYGGTIGLLESAAPWSRIPGVRGLVKDGEVGEETLLEHLVFGIALALMAGAAVDLDPLLDEDDFEDGDDGRDG